MTTASGKASAPGPASSKGALLGAMFLMATSAIGPGFIQQTTSFTIQLGAAFAFAILLSVIVDICVQLNVWRVIGVSGIRAQDLGNRVLPGLGHVVVALVGIGGLLFNIGNIGGTSLGLGALFGVEQRIGAAISAIIAIAIFLLRRAAKALDRMVVVLGVVMIALTVYVAVVAGPPVGAALRQTVLPSHIDFLAITTIIGGSVGGYITFAGAHRLVDAGVTGPEQVKMVSHGSIGALLLTGVMRAVLFLAILGVVAAGVRLGAGNPTADAFEYAAGQVGLKLFGVILWAASLSSVVGASYTSVSFLISLHPAIERRRNWVVCAFIAVAALVFIILNQAPTTLLVLAGALNGLILPVGFGVLLWVAARRGDLLGGYRYPRWLLTIGILAWLLTVYLSWQALADIGKLWS